MILHDSKHDVYAILTEWTTINNLDEVKQSNELTFRCDTQNKRTSHDSYADTRLPN